jgi:hypothetical protein
MVRVKLIQDSALHVDTNIQGYISLFDKYSLNKFFYLLRLTNLGPDLLIADDTGHLYRISWDGSVHQHLTISLNTLSYTTSLNSDRGLFNIMIIIHLNILL